jgi:hypothetical protein
MKNLFVRTIYALEENETKWDIRNFITDELPHLMRYAERELDESHLYYRIAHFEGVLSLALFENEIDRDEYRKLEYIIMYAKEITHKKIYDCVY